MVKPTQGIGSTAKSRTALIVSLAAPTTLRTWELSVRSWTKLDLFTFWGIEADFSPAEAFLAPRPRAPMFGLFEPFGITLCCFLWNSKRSANLSTSPLREDFLTFLPHNPESCPDPLLPPHLLIFLLLLWRGNFCSSCKSFSLFEREVADLVGLVGLVGIFAVTPPTENPPASAWSGSVLSFSEFSSISFHSSFCSTNPSGKKLIQTDLILYL